ncbi:MAG: hypothetical protein ABIA97_03580 [Candidatus Omnitrophota bacterium]
MGWYCFKLGIIFSVLALVTFIFPDMSFSGGGFKEKFQQKINASNVQFQGALEQKDDNQFWSYNYDADGYGQEEAKVPISNAIRRGGDSRLDMERVQSIERPAIKVNPNPVISSYAIYQTDYNAEIEENVVTVKGKVIFEVFREGWTKLPLVKSNVGLIDVSVNRGTAFVITQGDKYYLMIDRPGRYTLNLEFLIKATRERENGPGKFIFDVMPAPISQFEFTMPETEVEIFVEPAIKVEVKKEKNKTSAWAVMPNTSLITTRWTKALPKEDIKPVVLEPKIYLNTETYTSIGEGIVRCWSLLNFSILQSEVSNFRISLPEDVSLLDVTGKDLRDWNVSQDKGVQYLDVYLNYGVKGNYILSVNYERSIGAGSVVAEVPVLKTLGIERENGFFGIAASTNVELAMNKAKGVTLVDVKELPSSIWSKSTSPILLAVKYLNHPFEIAIDVTRHEELPVLIAAVDVAEYVTLHTEEGKLLTKATYQVRNNVKQYLRFTLPKGATLWSAFVASKPVKPAKDKNGSILVPLQKSQLQGESLTRFPVEIVYLDQGSKMKMMGQMKIDLPRIDIPISEMHWTVYFPSDYSYFKFGGDVKKVKGRFRPMATFGAVQRAVSSKAEILDEVSTTSQYEPYYIQGDYQHAANGRLPIKIDVPQQGRSIRFSKLLVTENESPWLSLSYTSILQKLSLPFRLALLVILILFLGGKVVKKKKIPKT